MPFRVELELKSKTARALWVKAISAFHTISDSFKIVIRQGTESGYDEQGRKCYSEVAFITMNKTKTSILNTSFKACYFKTFKIDGEVEEGSRVSNGKFAIGGSYGESTENTAKSYTMIVNSQDMNILFRDCGEDAVSWRIFFLSGNEIAHMVYSNKIFVEFDSKSGMKKKYSMVYRPGINTADARIHYIYLKTLENQKRADEKEANKALNGFEKDDNMEGEGGDDEDEDFFDDDDMEDDRVHRFAIDSIIFKRFLQTFPNLLEDFRIEINPSLGVIAFKGYNRQSILSRMDSIEKRPMTLGIQMKLHDIVYNNIKVSEGENADSNKKIEVSFRLKNFKIFMQIISGNVLTFQDDDDNGDRRNISDRSRSTSHLGEFGGFDDEDNVCDVMFSKSGYPIIFERRYFRDGDNELLECCSVTLTEVTDGESGKIILEMNPHVPKIPIRSVETVEPKVASIERTNHVIRTGSEPLFVAEDEEEEDLQGLNNYEGNLSDGHILATNQSKSGTGEEFENIFWNNTKYHQSTVHEKRDVQIGDVEPERNANKIYNEPEEEEEEEEEDDNGRYDYEDDDEKENNDENDGYLGPTQTVAVKGIFD